MVEVASGRGDDREGLVGRLFATFAMQVKEIEAKAREGAEALDVAKALGGLAKTLDTLLTLDRRVAIKDDAAAQDVEGLRAKVMERLSSLRRTRTVVKPA